MDLKKEEISIGKTALKNLVMGGTAGIIGASTTYPLDMIKTRMQNQKTTIINGITTKMYNNSWDCFKKIVNKEGIRGLYRGLPAQLVGITPEKAIKLTINDLLRYLFTDKKTGEIKIIHEAIAGATAGFSQVIATNPYEIVKVRLQTSNLVDGQKSKSALNILRELGIRGLFTGAPACLLRDVPFSAIYFTLYGNLKKLAKDEKGHISTLKLFLCGISAGVVSAGAVTPADVIKTRLQVKNTDGKQYKGIIDCFLRILHEEGPTAFFKGTVPRIMIISPLFGITLMTYEVLQGYFL
jgi:solute carrier family 25 aspartate/glutamate transporter 12/13